MNLGNRSLRLVLFAAAVGALGFGAYVAKSGVAHKAEAQRTAALARDRARDTGQALVYAQQRDKWVSSATQLVSDSKQSGIAPEQWVERKVNYRGVSATRVEADRLVRDTAVAQGRLFVTENFEISVLGGGEGLFDTPSAEDRGLVLTLAGSYYAWDLARAPIAPLPTLQAVQNAATASVAMVNNTAPSNASNGSLKK
jgi:hypothetical protein